MLCLLFFGSKQEQYIFNKLFNTKKKPEWISTRNRCAISALSIVDDLVQTLSQAICNHYYQATIMGNLRGREIKEPLCLISKTIVEHLRNNLYFNLIYL